MTAREHMFSGLDDYGGGVRTLGDLTTLQKGVVVVATCPVCRGPRMRVCQGPRAATKGCTTFLGCVDYPGCAGLLWVRRNRDGTRPRWVTTVPYHLRPDGGYEEDEDFYCSWDEDLF